MPDFDVHARVIVRAPTEDEAINAVSRRIRRERKRADDPPVYPVGNFAAVERQEPPRGWGPEKGNA